MIRRIVAVVLGLVTWMVVATVCDRLLRAAWDAYAAAVPVFAFSLPMLFARLGEGALATISGGFVVAAVTRKSRGAALAMGVVLLLFFVPTHAMLWQRFPAWYHALFLLSLVPLTMLASGRTNEA
jgi:hypothetical protein